MESVDKQEVRRKAHEKKARMMQTRQFSTDYQLALPQKTESSVREEEKPLVKDVSHKHFFFRAPESLKHNMSLSQYSSLGDLSRAAPRLDASEHLNPINLMETELWKEGEQVKASKNRRSEKYIEFIQKMAGPLANKVLHQNSSFAQKHIMGVSDSAPITPTSQEVFHGNDTYFQTEKRQVLAEKKPVKSATRAMVPAIGPPAEFQPKTLQLMSHQIAGTNFKDNLMDEEAARNLLNETITNRPPQLLPNPESALTPEEINIILKRNKSLPVNPSHFVKILSSHLELSDRFCYCNRVGDFYHFEVIRFNEKNEDDYITVSSRGIVQSVKGDLSFISVPAWEREARIYKEIKKIGFFQIYGKWKNFALWVKCMKRSRSKKIVENISRELFYLDPVLNLPLIKMKDTIGSMASFLMIRLQTSRTVRIEQFREDQRKLKRELNFRIKDIRERVMEQLSQASFLSMQAFSDEYRLEQLNFNEIRGHHANAQEGFGSLSLAQKTKALDVKLKQEPFMIGDESHKWMTYTQEATRRTHCKKLTRFIRLVDYIVIDHKLQLVRNNLSKTIEILSTLNSRLNRQMERWMSSRRGKFYRLSTLHKMPIIDNRVIESPIFEIEVGYRLGEDHEIRLQPDESEVCQAMDEAVHNAIGVITQGENMIHEDEFKFYTKSWFENKIGIKDKNSTFYRHNDPNADHIYPGRMRIEGSRIGNSDYMRQEFTAQTLIQRDPVTKQMQIELSEVIHEAFERARERVQEFAEYLEIHEKNTCTNIIEEYEDKQVEDFRAAIRNYKEQEIELQSFEPIVQLGILRLNATNLKNAVRTTPSECLTTLKEFMPDLIFRRMSELRKELQQSSSTLQRFPANVAKFVDFVKFFREMQTKFDDYHLRFTDIKDFNDTMFENQVKQPFTNDTEYSVVKQQLRRFESSLVQAQDFIESKEVKFKKELEDSLPLIERKASDYLQELKNPRISDVKVEREKVTELMGELEERIKNFNQHIKNVKHWLAFLEMEDSEFPLANLLNDDFHHKLKVWRKLTEFEDRLPQWLQLSFVRADMKKLNQEVQPFEKIALNIIEYFTNDPLHDDLVRKPPMLAVSQHFLKQVQQLKNLVPIVINLRELGAQVKYWDKVNEMLDLPLPSEYNVQPRIASLKEKEHNEVIFTDESERPRQPITLRSTDLTLKNLLDYGVLTHKGEIMELSMRAKSQTELNHTYHKMVKEWIKLTIETQPYREKKHYYVLTGVEELMTQLDEMINSLGVMLGNRYVETVREEAQKLLAKVTLLQEIIEEAATLQRHWVYLEGIFENQEIQYSLPVDSKKFAAVDAFFRQLMKGIWENHSAKKLIFTQKEGLLSQIKNHLKTLEEVQAALEAYLEGRRKEFPRFFFLSNDELLNLLSESKSIDAMQRQLPKCFENVAGLIFREIPADIAGSSSSVAFEDTAIGMISLQGERIAFYGKVKARGTVEAWMSGVQFEMKRAVRRSIKQAHDYVEMQDPETFSRAKWSNNFPAQAVSIADSIIFCRNTESVLLEEDLSLEVWLQEHMLHLTQLSAYIGQGSRVASLISSLQSTPKTENQPGPYGKSSMRPIKRAGTLILPDQELFGATESQRTSLTNLITQDVHYRDVLQELVNMRVQSPGSFYWQRHLRYQQAADDMSAIYVKQLSSTIKYGFEYIGASERLVVTPLTDRCWLSLTSSMQMAQGGVLAGPPGSGKTESVRDLAKGVARLCVVFNCSKQISYKMMERFFAGMANCAAWGCLDEFNRIEVDVMSVIAHQFETIRNAMLTKKAHFQFGEREIDLKELAEEEKDDKIQITQVDGNSPEGTPIDVRREGAGSSFNPATLWSSTAPPHIAFGFFITMNPRPAVGRHQLPENLKGQLRPVAMMIPDYSFVAEIMLYAAGFKQSSHLAEKLSNLFKLGSEQLQNHRHYDFGMRTLKSVIIKAGRLKESDQQRVTDEKIKDRLKLKTFAQKKKEEAEGSSVKEEDEDLLIIDALQLIVEPRVTQEDRDVFHGILADFFPTLMLPKIKQRKSKLTPEIEIPCYSEDDRQLLESVKEIFKESRDLFEGPRIMQKVMQLSHVLHIKSGAIVIGKAMTGKTTAVRLLARGLNKVVDNLDQVGIKKRESEFAAGSSFLTPIPPPISSPNLFHLDTYDTNLAKGTIRECISAEVINPKSLTISELYGKFSHLSQEWSDGLASSIIREFSSEATTAGPPSHQASASKLQRWVVFDGPVDTYWVQNLNTVLDQNMTLCLANGERIKLNKRLRLIFECDSLAACSPSTVSRCGVVFFDNDTVNWRLLLQSWLAQNSDLKQDQQQYVSSLFETTIDNALLFMKRNTPQAISRPVPCLASAVISLLNVLIGKGLLQIPLTTSRQQIKTIIRRSYIFSLAWAMAGMTLDAMVKIQSFLSTEFAANDLPKGSVFENHLKLESEGLSLSARLTSSEQTHFGYWTPWKSIFPKEMAPPPVPLLPKQELKPQQPLYDGYDLAESQRNGHIYIPTQNSVRYGWIIGSLCRNGVDCLVTGPSFSGKTNLMEHVSSSIAKSEMVSSSKLALSSASQAQQVQFSIERMLEKRRKNILGGPSGKPLVIMMDDVHLSPLEKSSRAQPVIELLRYMVDHRALFDREKHYKKQIIQTTVLCGAGLPRSIEQQNQMLYLSQRFSRHFFVVTHQPPNQEEMVSFFKTTMEAHFSKPRQLADRLSINRRASIMERTNAPASRTLNPIQTAFGFPLDITTLVGPMIEASLEILQKVQAQFLSTPGRAHYLFSVKNLIAVFHGMLRVLPSYIDKAHKFVRLWIHEFMREFGDRLITDEEKSRLTQKIASHFAVRFKLNWDHDEVFSKKNPIVFTDIIDVPSFRHHQDKPTDSLSTQPDLLEQNLRQVSYTELDDMHLLQKAIQRYQSFYNVNIDRLNALRVANNQNKQTAQRTSQGTGLEVVKGISHPMAKYDLVLFKEMLIGITKIARVLRMPGGRSLILMGVPGTGRQTLTRLAAFICRNQIVDFACLPPKERVAENTGAKPNIIRRTVSTIYRRNSRAKRDLVPTILEESDKLEGKQNKLFSSKLTRSFFRECLINVIHMSGVQGKHACLIINDNLIEEDSIFEDIMNEIRQGDVPMLLSDEQRDRIIRQFKAENPDRSHDVSDQKLLNFILPRARARIHFVICVSEGGPTIRKMCRDFPQLISDCTIDRYTPWPNSALQQVAAKFLEDDLSRRYPLLKQRMLEMAVKLHQTAVDFSLKYEQNEACQHNVYITPKTYLEMMRGLKKMLIDRHFKLSDRLDQLQNGLLILEEAGVQVTNMRDTLTEIQPRQQQNAREITELSLQLEKQQKQAKRQQMDVEAETDKLNIQSEEVDVLHKNAQVQLQKVMPALHAANTALTSLSQGDILELKKTSKPSLATLAALQAVAIVLKEKTEWPDLKKMISQTNFFHRLINFEKDSVGLKTIKRLKVHINSNMIMQNLDELEKGSKAARQIVEWVLAIKEYALILQDTKPLRAKEQQLSQLRDESIQQLNAKKAEVDDLLMDVGKIEKRLHDARRASQKVVDQIQTTKNRLRRAEILTSQMKEEHSRWTAILATLKDKLKRFAGDVLLAAGCVAYAGPFPKEFRGHLIDLWADQCFGLAIPVSRLARIQYTLETQEEEERPRKGVKFELRNVLSDQAEITDWTNRAQLPNDYYTIDNAIIVEHSVRAPLILDPQGIAKRWLLQRYYNTDQHIHVVPNLRDHSLFLQTISSAAVNGNSVLIELEEREDRAGKKISLDPVLQMLLIQYNEAAQILMDKQVEISLNAAAKRNIKLALGRNSRHIGVIEANRVTRSTISFIQRRKIIIGQEEIDISHDFKVYLIAKSSQSQFLPQLLMNTQTINFEMTEEAMRELLLNHIVKIECPQLESTRVKLTMQNLNDRKKVSEYEDKILVALNEYITQGETEIKGAALAVLDDQRLIVQLERSKELTAQIKKRIENNAQTHQKIQNIREDFRQVSDRAAFLQFMITEHISKLHWMYQFSHDFFISSFVDIVKREKEAFVKDMGSTKLTTDYVMNLPRRQVLRKVDHLLEVILKDYFVKTNRALFHKHQLIFGFVIIITLQMKEGGTFRPAYLDNPFLRVERRPLSFTPSKRSSRRSAGKRRASLFSQGNAPSLSVLSPREDFEDYLMSQSSLESDIKTQSTPRIIEREMSPRGSGFSITKDELQFFLHGSKGFSQLSVKIPMNPDDDLLSDENWQEFGALEKLVGRKILTHSVYQSLGRRKSSLGNILKTQHSSRGGKFPFAGITQHMCENFEEWFKWLSQQHPEDAVLPQPWNQDLTLFQKLMLVRIIKPQNLTDCVRKLVREVLGPDYAEERSQSQSSSGGPASGVMAQLTQLYSEINANDPVLLLVKEGSDPTTSLREFAQEMNGKRPHQAAKVGVFGINLKRTRKGKVTEQDVEEEKSVTSQTESYMSSQKMLGVEKKLELPRKSIMARSSLIQEPIVEEAQDALKVISMGQGQGPIAERVISRAIKQGHWVFLQNCDLIPSWHLRLEKILEKIKKAYIVEKFRLGSPYLLKKGTTKVQPMDIEQSSEASQQDRNFNRRISGLSSSFLSTEEIKRLETEENEKSILQIHPNFRLFLSAQQNYSEEFLEAIGEDQDGAKPTIRDTILSHTIKLTVQNPVGLKASLQRATAQLRRCITEPFNKNSQALLSMSTRRLTSRSPSIASILPPLPPLPTPPHAHYCKFINDGSDLVGLGDTAVSEGPLRMAFAICWLHVNLGGRRQFGKLGWNVPYSFSDNDLVSALLQLDTQLSLMHTDTNSPSTLFEALRLIVGLIVYGGRVTEEQDRLVLNGMIDKYLNDEVMYDSLQGKIHYYLWKGGKFQQNSAQIQKSSTTVLEPLKSQMKVPKRSSLPTLQLHNNDLFRIPLADSMESLEKYVEQSNLPELFDEKLMELGQNAILNLQISNTRAMINELEKTEPPDTTIFGKGGVAQSSQAFRKSYKEVDFTAQDFLEKMPLLLTMKEASKDLLVPDTRTKLIKPLDSFLIMEIDRFNALLRVVNRGLEQLRSALKGEVSMTAETDEIYDSFVKKRIPRFWRRHSYLTQRNLGNWYNNLVERVAYLRDWVVYNQPSKFWIAGFFLPQSFVTSVMQTASRASQCEIDQLGVSIDVLDQTYISPCYSDRLLLFSPEPGNKPTSRAMAQFTVEVYGMQIQGGRIDKNSKLLVDELPSVQKRNVPSMRWNIIPYYEPEPDTVYHCPLYRTGDRSGLLNTTGQSLNLVTFLDLKTRVAKEQWILRGVALFLELIEEI